MFGLAFLFLLQLGNGGVSPELRVPILKVLDRILTSLDESVKQNLVAGICVQVVLGGVQLVKHGDCIVVSGNLVELEVLFEELF